jgi:hypothetical protein
MDDEKYSDHPRRNDYLYGLFYERVDPTYIGSPFGWFPVPLEALEEIIGVEDQPQV